MGIVRNLQGDRQSASVVKTTLGGIEGAKNRNSINFKQQQEQVELIELHHKYSNVYKLMNPLGILSVHLSGSGSLQEPEAGLCPLHCL